MIFDLDKLQAEIMASSARSWDNRTLDQLGPIVPEDQDPNVLFRHNWLARGQAFGLVASSGVGKSSMVDQMAYNWAMGYSFLAYPTRELKIAVIQAEDSDRDLQDQRDGMIRGFLEDGWEPSAVKEAISRVYFPTDFIGVQGDLFINMLKEYQGDNRLDLIFINPLQRFFGADISNQADTSKFCAGIDVVMKDKDSPCAVGMVMHTPKFHSGNKDNRQSIDDYAEYAMAGSQEWTAWVRAVINIQKHKSSERFFDVKASKRGKKLHWTDFDGNETTKRYFKHSDDFIYWQEVTDKNEIESAESAPKSSAPTEEDISKIARSMVEWIRNNRAVTRTEFQDKPKVFRGLDLNREKCRLAYRHVMANFKDYHLKEIDGKIGFADGIRAAMSLDRQQRAVDETRAPQREMAIPESAPQESAPLCETRREEVDIAHSVSAMPEPPVEEFAEPSSADTGNDDDDFWDSL